MRAFFILIQNNWLMLTLIILVSITTLSLWPVDSLPSVPGTDKTHHFIAYGALMFPVALRKPRHWLWIGLGFIVYSGAIELIQPYANRYGEWLDLAANTGGIVCGVLFAQLVGLLFMDA
uniref:VanZ-like domain-containing protein n=1 Tax=uncultured Thiotrichaceae bacterium TaxID=298394 RepID=A0A6S6U9P6_9GAMM|nr:MAG: Unknown protein [uncultured Thiotrichaceae bacterium]